LESELEELEGVELEEQFPS